MPVSLLINRPLLSTLMLLATVTACDPPPDLSRIGSLTTNDLPLSPTNAYADDPEAAAFGQALFFDRRMSADEEVGCVSCHAPDRAFADPRAFSEGAFGRVGNRHAPSLLNVAFNQFQLWDGRADALWSQPIKAIEAEPEGDFTRTEVAHFITRTYADEYSALFGPLPDLDHLPARAKPGDAEWAAMSDADQDAVNRISANIGKAIEAYERKLLCVDTEFDRYMAGEGELSILAFEGARIFLNDAGAGCVDCHSGPNLTDGLFHNLGLDHPNTPDQGRAAGITALLDDPFNGVGAFSDDQTAGAAVLANLSMGDRRDLGAFKTPGLRGVGQRDRFGHLGHETNLARWIDNVYRRGGGGPGGRGRGGQGAGGNFVGQLSPDFPRNLPGNSEQALAAFLRTLDCPPLPAELTRAPAGVPTPDRTAPPPNATPDATPDATAPSPAEPQAPQTDGRGGRGGRR